MPPMRCAGVQVCVDDAQREGLCDVGRDIRTPCGSMRVRVGLLAEWAWERWVTSLQALDGQLLSNRSHQQVEHAMIPSLIDSPEAQLCEEEGGMLCATR